MTIACTQCTRDGAALVDDKVLDNRTLAATVRVASKVTEEALTLCTRTVDNHVLDAEALTVERAVVLLAVVRTYGTVQVLDVLKVDVVHQLTVRVEIAIGNQVRDPLHIARIVEHVEAICILLRSLEVCVASVVHRTDTVHVSMIIGESSCPNEPHEGEDDERGKLSHCFVLFRLVNNYIYNNVYRRVLAK